jgi:hypothetical protein
MTAQFSSLTQGSDNGDSLALSLSIHFVELFKDRMCDSIVSPA